MGRPAYVRVRVRVRVLEVHELALSFCELALSGLVYLCHFMSSYELIEV